MRIWASVVLGALVAARFAAAQSGAVDHYSQAEIASTADALHEKATGSGTAATTLKDYGPDKTMISVRTKDGGAEVHAEFADYFYVLRGHATLLTGGDVVAPTEAGPGETRGTSLKNATSRTALGPGDVVHIPAAIPHQLLLDSGGDFSYFVIKVKEAPAR